MLVAGGGVRITHYVRFLNERCHYKSDQREHSGDAVFGGTPQGGLARNLAPQVP